MGERMRERPKTTVGAREEVESEQLHWEKNINRLFDLNNAAGLLVGTVLVVAILAWSYFGYNPQ